MSRHQQPLIPQAYFYQVIRKSPQRENLPKTHSTGFINSQDASEDDWWLWWPQQLFPWLETL